MNITLSARERLNVNLSTTLAELITTSVKLWSIENDQPLQKSRGIYAPYRIRNRTGSTILVWSDLENTSSNKDLGASKILNNQVIDWRFDDWKTMREVSFAHSHRCIFNFPYSMSLPANIVLVFKLLGKRGNNYTTYLSIAKENLSSRYAPEQSTLIDCFVKSRLWTT